MGMVRDAWAGAGGKARRSVAALQHPTPPKRTACHAAHPAAAEIPGHVCHCRRCGVAGCAGRKGVCRAAAGAARCERVSTRATACRCKGIAARAAARCKGVCGSAASCGVGERIGLEEPAPKQIAKGAEAVLESLRECRGGDEGRWGLLLYPGMVHGSQGLQARTLQPTALHTAAAQRRSLPPNRGRTPKPSRVLFGSEEASVTLVL